MKRIIYILAAVVTVLFSMTSCRWQNDEVLTPSEFPERMFAQVVQYRHDKYVDVITRIIMLDRYLSLDDEARDKFVNEYGYRESIVYNTSTRKYTIDANCQYDHRVLVVERIGEKSLSEGGEWITDDGEILRHIDGNTFWFSSITSEAEPQPEYAQQIECQFCDDDLIITAGRKQLSLKVLFRGSGTTSYSDSRYDFDIDYKFDSPLEYRHYFGQEHNESISGQATLLVNDRSGEISKQVTAYYSRDNDIRISVKDLK